MQSVPRTAPPAKSRRKPTLAAAVPASQWPSWTDRPFDAVVGALYVAELSAPAPRKKGGR